MSRGTGIMMLRGTGDYDVEKERKLYCPAGRIMYCKLYCRKKL